jgi:hypothetical protein
MSKLFISYRREDSDSVAHRIADSLKAHFGRSSVVIDVDNIPLGADFRKHLTGALDQSDVVLAIIGESWLTISENLTGQRRIDAPNDYVRFELKSALDNRVPVIPLLIGQTMMPLEQSLPEEIKELAYRQAAQVDPGKDFHLYMDRIIKQLEDLLAHRKACAPSTAASKNEPVPPAARAHLDELVRSASINPTGYGYVDNRGQAFAKLKIAMGTVEAVKSYLESCLSSDDDDFLERVIPLIIKFSDEPEEQALRKASLIMQTSASSTLRGVLADELAELSVRKGASWEPCLQTEVVEGLKFAAEYDNNDVVRAHAIKAIAKLKRAEGSRFLGSIVSAKKGDRGTLRDWSEAISALASAGDGDAARVLSGLCTDPHTQADVLHNIVFWVNANFRNFEGCATEIKEAFGDGAMRVLNAPEAINNEPHADAAFMILIRCVPDQAVEMIPRLLESHYRALRNAVVRSIREVRQTEQPFLRLLKQNPRLLGSLTTALEEILSDRNSDESLRWHAREGIDRIQRS